MGLKKMGENLKRKILWFRPRFAPTVGTRSPTHTYTHTHTHTNLYNSNNREIEYSGLQTEKRHTHAGG